MIRLKQSKINCNVFFAGFLAAGASFGAVLVLLLLSVYGNNINKKLEILFASVFYFVGSFCQSYSDFLDWTSSSAGLILLLIGNNIVSCLDACLPFVCT